jgi:hypothetical protein
MASDNTFVVFYSNYCSHCKNFLINLKKVDEALYNTFTKICVDNNPGVPSAIKSVPTIIVPSHPHPLTDSSVSMWLDTLAAQYITNNQSNTMNSTTNHQANNVNQPNSANQPNSIAESDSSGILPYVSGEMGTQFSDGFSFLDSDPQSAQPITHQFAFLSGDQVNLANTSHPVNNTVDRPSAPQVNSNSFDSQYEQFMNTRDGDPFIQRPHQRC